ncbi:hypothetical protein E2C01_053599 [Portunus trituberculatus]|uniref:Uncharacterized protein n=1 Tax=Portunus trituberculatus TaxID=210409 RepID=A0A5B7GQJ1_PORTR|nr:hypothetical protein [Portunus trituberculatus]
MYGESDMICQTLHLQEVLISVSFQVVIEIPHNQHMAAAVGHHQSGTGVSQALVGGRGQYRAHNRRAERSASITRKYITSISGDSHSTSCSLLTIPAHLVGEALHPAIRGLHLNVWPYVGSTSLFSHVSVTTTMSALCRCTQLWYKSARVRVAPEDPLSVDNHLCPQEVQTVTFVLCHQCWLPMLATLTQLQNCKICTLNVLPIFFLFFALKFLNICVLEKEDEVKLRVCGSFNGVFCFILNTCDLEKDKRENLSLLGFQ